MGGGSGTDAGKAISFVPKTSRNLWGFDFNLTPPPELTQEDFVPLFCVPTTSGTGGGNGKHRDDHRLAAGVKGKVWHPAQKTFAAPLDPKLTIGLPRHLTAWAGCDALSDAIEAYCAPRFHPMCDGIALQALAMIHHALPVAVTDPIDVAARGLRCVGCL